MAQRLPNARERRPSASAALDSYAWRQHCRVCSRLRLPLDWEIATDTRWRSAARGCHHVGFSIAFALIPRSAASLPSNSRRQCPTLSTSARS